MKNHLLIILFSLIANSSCNKAFFIDRSKIVNVKKGAILLMSNEYYFINKKFGDEDDLIKFITKPDKILYNLKRSLGCNMEGVVPRVKFKKINRNIIPESSSVNSDSEIRYLNATIKVIYDDPFFDDKTRTLNLVDYDNVKQEFNLKYKLEHGVLYLVIPDN